MPKTILQRLTIHRRVVALAVILVGGTGVLGMEWVRRELGHLTRRSTPYQIRTLDLQRAIQSLATGLANLADRDGAGLDLAAAEIDRNLEEIRIVQDSLAALALGEKMDAWQELSSPSKDLVAATRSHVDARRSVVASDSAIDAMVGVMDRNLKQLDHQIRKLQETSQASFESSQARSVSALRRQREVEDAKSLIKDEQLAAQQIQSATSKREVLQGKAKHNAAIATLQQGGWGKESESELRSVSTNFDELAKAKTAIIAGSTAELQEKFDASRKTLEERLNALSLAIGQESMLVGERSGMEATRQGDAFRLSVIANQAMASNAELLSLGFAIDGDAMQLFQAKSEAEIQVVARSLEARFDRAAQIRQQLGRQLAQLKASDAFLQSSWSGMESVETQLLGKGGAMANVRKGIAMDAEELRLTLVIRRAVQSQSVRAKATLEAARGDQASSVTRVNRTIGGGSILIVLISAGAVAFGFWYGSRLYRSIQVPLQELIDVTERVSQGDLGVAIVDSGDDEIGSVLSAVARMVASLRAMVERIGAETRLLTLQSTRLADTANGLGDSTQRQNVLVTNFQTSIGAMSDSIDAVIRGTEETSRRTVGMQSVTQEGIESTQRMVGRMRDLESLLAGVEARISALQRSSQDVGEVVVAIQSIAGQAHLLSFNATIEAVRAGEAGRGFAVVAEEFRNLSQKSKRSSGEASRSIEQIRHGVREVCQEVLGEIEVVRTITEEIVRIGEGMERIGMEVGATAKAIDGIVQSAETQGKVRNFVAQGTSEISGGSQALEAMSEGVRTTADQLSEIADRLDELMRWFTA